MAPTGSSAGPATTGSWPADYNDYYGQTWWYLTNSGFASSYAKTHPLEDFAESFAACFLQRAGKGWYWSDGVGAKAIPAKINLINTWVTSLQS